MLQNKLQSQAFPKAPQAPALALKTGGVVSSWLVLQPWTQTFWWFNTSSPIIVTFQVETMCGNRNAF
jgi:hypothetical protein